MKGNTRLDHIELYAERLAADNSGFKQHKKIINSQLRASKELFSHKFGKNFKKEARTYLRETGII